MGVLGRVIGMVMEELVMECRLRRLHVDCLLGGHDLIKMIK
jgi:hypothetical protein